MNKDEDQIRQTAESLDLIADLKLLSSQPMLSLAESLMHHLQVYKKRQKDELWTPIIVKLLKLYSKNDHYLEESIELADPMNNRSA